MNAQLKQRLEALLEGRLSLADFSAWLWEFTWDMDAIPPADRNTVLAVENALAELTGGHVSSDEFLAFIRPMVRKPAIVVTFQPASSRPATSTAARTLRVSPEAAYA